MKKSWIVITVAIIVIGGSVAFWLTRDSNKDATKQSAGQTSRTDNKYAAKDACDELTAAIAAKILGAEVEKGTLSPGASSEDVSVSTCVYTTKAGDDLESIRNIRSASVLVRSPLSKTGADSNHTPFHERGTDTKEVPGVGHMAYWDPEMGQLNVITDDETWYILTVGKSRASDRTSAEAKALASEMGL